MNFFYKIINNINSDIMDNIVGSRTNLELEINEYGVQREVKKGFRYHLIRYQNEDDLYIKLKQELLFFLKKLKFKKGDFVLISGIGNENHTVDSVGPKTLNYIKTNAYLKNKLDKDTKVAAIEPRVLYQTGIKTEMIIKGVVDEIKPNLLILIDSLVSDNITYLNHVIELTDAGLIQGYGIKGLESEITKKSIGIPVLLIGVCTALEICLNDTFYILSDKNIDEFVNEICPTIGKCINEVLDSL